ncbi:MAG: M23 family metallopeptidase, partial [Holophagales bacterium]|nr:M23 family metallopeptidase [Holophagales bacterium]
SDFPKCHKVGGCYYSRYKHLSSTVVADETLVNKGQLIGYSGRNVSSTSHPNWSSAYPHVHFEIRAYPGGPDYYARGQREAIHPLQVLPYQDDNADDITVTITDVENGAHQSYGLVEVEVSLPNDTEELDLVRVDVAVYDEYGNEVTSTNPGAGYTTPDGDAYQLDPPFFDMELRSRQYNYTDTTKVPFEKFLPAGVAGNTVDGEWLSPYADPSNATYYMSNFPTSYNNSTADFHLEAKKSGTQEHIGRFNGIEVEPANFNRTYATYDLTLRFERMPLPSPGDSFCYKAWATDARNNTTNPDDATWGSCS